MKKGLDDGAMRILVVDDELHTREICCDFLAESKMNYQVESASDGHEALELLSKKPFHILLSDIQMPKMGGLELLKESRKLYPQLEVILMTAYGDLSSAIEALRFGAYDYITKPFSSDFLLKTVHRCSEKIELERRLKESQAKLIEQEKLAALGSVSAWLSHKMRNSLSVLMMCAHYLKAKTAHMNSQDLNEVIGAILDKIKSLEKITHDFISYSRSYEMQKCMGSINAVLNDMLDSLSVQIQIQKINVVKQLDPALPETACDPHMLTEAFENVFVNALQAIGKQENQSLTIKTTFVNVAQGKAKDGGNILISITNSGSEIPADQREKIFTPFFTTKENGSGLGLSILKKIVEQHGGSIAADSEARDGQKFTTISITLPALKI